jgi:hypothetical protein
MTTMPTAPGWYDDPAGRRRWWDGQRWGTYAPWGDSGAAMPTPAPAKLDPRMLHDPTAAAHAPAHTVVHHVVHAPAKELTAAYLLLLFLGTVGAHRFYLGRNGSWLVDIFLTPGMVREENRRALMATGQPGCYRGWPAA